jgi:phage portal protein BeeE
VPNLLRTIFPKAEKRADPTLSMDQWVDMWKFNGNNYPLARRGDSNKSEAIPNDFLGMVNGAYKASGVVFACSLARQLIFTEATFKYQKVENGRPSKDLEDGPGLDILDKPWPNGTTAELLGRMINDTDMCGNFFAVEEIGRLRRLRPDWVEIVLSAAPDKALRSDVVAYIYKPGGTPDPSLWEIFPIDGSNGRVVHWSPIPDPDAQYRGMSWLTPVIQEIMSDKAISRHKQKFFENAATPNLAISLSESVTKEEFEEFMQVMDSTKTGVEHAYENLYLGGGADVKVIGADIKALDFKSITGILETRIAAAARVHPAIVGLSEGMQGSTLNEGNFEAAKELLASGTIRPLWRSACTALAGLVDAPAGLRLWFDDRDIAFLREDRQKVAVLQQTQATTISRYVMQGFTPESARDAVIEDDLRKLEHTGLYSVQLLPPNISHPDKYPAEGGKAQPTATAKNNQKGRPKADGTPAKPPGRSVEEWIDLGATPELARRLAFEEDGS